MRTLSPYFMPLQETVVISNSNFIKDLLVGAHKLIVPDEWLKGFFNYSVCLIAHPYYSLDCSLYEVQLPRT